jgi:hypothetical protein
MRRIVLFTVLVLYFFASCVFSINHAFSENKWDYRQKRNGLLCVEFSKDEITIYSPFCNYADVYLFGISKSAEGFYVFSDGFKYFGEWDI